MLRLRDHCSVLALPMLVAVGCAGVLDLDHVRYEPAVADASAPKDAPSLDDVPSSLEPAFVQYGVGSMRALTIPTTIAPTKAGDLLAVTIAVEKSDVGSVVSISDDAPGGSNIYVSTNQTSTDLPCNDRSEIWYAKDIHAGATTVTVTMSATVEISTWVMEFSGLSRSDPLDTGAVVNNGPSGKVITAPAVTPSVPNAIVISTACTCEEITGIRQGSPFTNLPVQIGEGTAYFIAGARAPYGAVWESAVAGTFNASTVAFK